MRHSAETAQERESWQKIGADCSIIRGGTVSDVCLVLSKWSHKEKIGAASETKFSLFFF